MPNQIEKRLMHPRIFRQLRMERRGHRSSLPHGNRVDPFGRDDFHASADALDLGRADKDHFERRISCLPRPKPAFADRAVELSSVGVAPNADVEGSQAGLLGIFHFRS